jgi:hypothetical protein
MDFEEATGREHGTWELQSSALTKAQMSVE